MLVLAKKTCSTKSETVFLSVHKVITCFSRSSRLKSKPRREDANTLHKRIMKDSTASADARVCIFHYIFCWDTKEGVALA